MSFKLMTRLTSNLVLASLLLCQPSLGMDKAEQIDELMTYCSGQGLFNGAILVAQRGEVLYQKAFGFSEFETKAPLTLKSQFCLASVSKVFTGMAIMILAEQGKLDYDDALSKYFKQFPDYADRVTVLDLLHHTAGIRNWTQASNFRSSPGDFIDDITNEDVFKFLVEQASLEFEPGEKHAYSNSGYVLLAMIVEKVSGLSFREFMRRRIFEPLRMNHTVVYDASKPVIQHKVVGYNIYGDRDDYDVLTTGAGGIYATVDDLYRFDRALYTDQLISQNVLADAFVKPVLNDGTAYADKWGWSYGFGWEFRMDSTKYVVRQTGGFNGFSTVLYRELYDRTVIIILTNKGQSTWQRGATMVALLNIIDGQPFELPRVPGQLIMKRMIDEGGLQDALAQYRDSVESEASAYDLSERQLNNLGYYYLNHRDYDRALAVFKLNTEIFPSLANVYDSYGEACMLKGDYQEAAIQYRRSLELNPDNGNAARMLEHISGAGD